jgi:hypothetical protein
MDEAAFKKEDSSSKNEALVALAIAIGEEAAEIVLDMIIADEIPNVEFTWR